MAYTDEQIRTTKELLKQLRTTKGLSYERLASLIEEKENVPISRGALQYYEITDEDHERYKTTQGMSIEYLVALADFYGVSVDYLLGRTPCKEANNKEINKRISLSDSAIRNLELLVKKDKRQNKNPIYQERSAIINKLLSDHYFIKAIQLIALSIEYGTASGLSTPTEYIPDADEDSLTSFPPIHDYKVYSDYILYNAANEIASIIKSSFKSDDSEKVFCKINE